MTQLWLVTAVLLIAPSSSRVTTGDIVAPGNPHQGSCGFAEEGCYASSTVGNCECPAQSLNELTAANLMPQMRVQADSFLHLEKKSARGMEVNLYHFKQPARLSPLELPFKLLLLRQINLQNIQVFEVPPQQALDSWFPGYAWSILICNQCQGRHLGWKFTPAGAGAQEAFYALIVEAIEGDEAEAIATGVHKDFLARLKAVGQPLAAIGLAASALQNL
eukprot:TRINITY_DN100655_c0_g1_i1.p1 TRINITY_DN100655_c0_g1~~TRINITY_DN100655_c0_g1_i1.p1  ORF type:complete len:219 (+),score=45.83 TRINITY_DN100655_c0_g1_i1:60-716(+)